VKVSVTLSRELLKVLDRRAARRGMSRSDFIAAAIRAFTGQPTRTEQDARDLEIINRNAHFLNQEAADVLEYQSL